MECTKIMCPMQAGTTTDHCDDNCPWRTTVKEGGLISRWAAIDALTDTNLKRNVDSLCDGEVNRTRRAAQRVIAQLPAVDAVPVVHARWRALKDGTEECTNCGGVCPHEENYNGDVIFNFDCEYCPWCGAKMDEVGYDD